MFALTGSFNVLFHRNFITKKVYIHFDEFQMLVALLNSFASCKIISWWYISQCNSTFHIGHGSCKSLPLFVNTAPIRIVIQCFCSLRNHSETRCHFQNSWNNVNQKAKQVVVKSMFICERLLRNFGLNHTISGQKHEWKIWKGLTMTEVHQNKGVLRPRPQSSPGRSMQTLVLLENDSGGGVYHLNWSTGTKLVAVGPTQKFVGIIQNIWGQGPYIILFGLIRIFKRTSVRIQRRRTSNISTWSHRYIRWVMKTGGDCWVVYSGVWMSEWHLSLCGGTYAGVSIYFEPM